MKSPTAACHHHNHANEIQSRRMRILIADDNEVVRCAMRALLEAQSGWTVCGEAADGLGAIEKVIELRPELVLVDVSMPGSNGVEAAKTIREKLPECEILLVAEHDASVMKQMAERAGAGGFVLKSRMAYDLIPAVKAAAKHATV
ncbi:MAG: response regulator [Candidatus Acidiferrales bacterium]